MRKGIFRALPNPVFIRHLLPPPYPPSHPKPSSAKFPASDCLVGLFSPHDDEPIHTPRHTTAALLTRRFYQIS